MQSSGLGIQFLNLGGNDPASLEFPSIDENASDEFGDVDGEFRIAFRKLNKREANTREKVVLIRFLKISFIFRD